MKTLKLFILSITVLLSVSCESFLEEESISTTTADALYSTEEGIESLVNASYTVTRKWYGKFSGYLLSEAGTDQFLMAGWGTGYIGFHTYNSNLQGSEKPIEHIWSATYKGINSCNAAIERIPGSPLSESTKTLRLGEVHFLRAFYYYHLVETFGPVPIRTQETSSPELEATRAPVNDVYDLIFSDLEVALTNLEGQVTPGGGRVIQPAVEAFLARIYLTRGMNQEALNMAEKLINDYDFELNEDYTTMWNMENSDANLNPEAIWFVNYAADNNLNDVPRGDALGYMWLWEGGHHGHLYFTPYYYNARPGLRFSLEYDRPLNQLAPSRYLIELYNDEIDARYEGTFRDTWLANDEGNLPEGMQLGDTVLYVANKVLDPEYKASKSYEILDLNDIYNADGTLGGDKTMYYHMKKFNDDTRSAEGVIESKRDAIVFRLAEMYMIAAEASMKLGNNQAGADYINVVRERAAYPGEEAAMRITADQVNIDFILDERAREFVGEQLRWFDLKRTGKLIERLDKYNVAAAANVEPYHLVRPIPQVELDVVQNKEEFQQNDHYN
ncbi:RagB/SusD family nutrient uptake outer membrane protein [Echinicola jeungdonensis]|uniref:RagB/SusD family nutrient uptake outer membrane protein n=1 Tax=Echinicola jeungdonensis TaxID=709343 RepID=A0ABV5J378_9BACT|nr:RagB/SusD family nutrient uptake outer membrane protein [Echinicola jeungdonensis]MDN3668917.1 RagB/SusD family nutrient uptake outer membrane protein [Echinicola jeungdonensis]